jgi:hypothetical protein
VTPQNLWQIGKKIQLSAEEWNTIKAAVEHGVAMPTDASKSMLLGYHYALQKQSNQLARERSEIQKRKDLAIAASIAFHKACSDTSYTGCRRHHMHRSRVENLEHSERRNLSKNLDLSFLLVDEQGNIIPNTPEAALVAAQTYLYTTRPSPGDPREHMHQAILQGLRMVGNKLLAKCEEAYHNKGTHKPRSPRRRSSSRCRSSSRRSRSSSPRHHKSPKHGGTRRSRTPTKAYNYEDDKKEMGASCFTHRVRTIPVRWSPGATTVAPRLFVGSQNIRRNKGDNNAKSTITPHLFSSVMVEQIGKRNNQKLGGAHEAIYE